ncbi:GNAT family N-acetyltransferase [Streptomyces sp. NPDC088785]|uniref:GNAT family N-acetyltransferase n=1 Tax=Streptomyces sp. NPDC088785 TaxID=3365897 RepID=UPI00380B4EFE
MDFVVRAVEAGEWPAVKELRLEALRDEVASIAFLETYEQAVGRSDAFWRERAAGASHGTAARQFVAVADSGRWLGTAVALVEEPGTTDFLGHPVEERQVQIVGVYVRPEARGGHVAPELFAAASAWAYAQDGIGRVRLHFHQDNARAEGLYRKIGFVRTGRVVPLAGDPAKVEYEMVLDRAGR